MKFKILKESKYKDYDVFAERFAKDLDKLGFINYKNEKLNFIKDLYEIDDIKDILNKNDIKFNDDNLDDIIYKNYDLFDENDEGFNEFILEVYYDTIKEKAEECTKIIHKLIKELSYPGSIRFYDEQSFSMSIKFILNGDYRWDEEIRQAKRKELAEYIDNSLGEYSKYVSFYFVDYLCHRPANMLRFRIPNILYVKKNDSVYKYY